MNKYKKVLLVVFLVLIMGIYFGYKAFNLYVCYNYDLYRESVDKFNIKDTIYINKKEIGSEEEYLGFDNIKIRDDFKDFELMNDGDSTNDLVKYMLYDEKREVIAGFWMQVIDTKVNRLDSYVLNDNSYISSDDVDSFLRDNNIGNDIEFFKYLDKNKDRESNIFTSIRDMKEIYIIKASLNARDVVLMDGDYTGYMLYFNNNDAREVHILYNDKAYVLTFFMSDYFSEEYIRELLSTVVID